MKKYNFSRIIISSFLFICVLLTPFVIFVILNSKTTLAGMANYDNTAPVTNSNAWYTNPSSPQFLTLARLAIISLVVSFGSLGSVVSLLSRRQKEAQVISNISLSELIVIKSVGAIFAIILMLFFWGGLISGVLFPRVSFGQFMTIYVHQDLAKLIVWSFIAGFSERLVPRLIENIQRRINTDAKKEE